MTNHHEQEQATRDSNALAEFLTKYPKKTLPGTYEIWFAALHYERQQHKMPFDQWFNDIKKCARVFLQWPKECIDKMDAEAWREYYDEGYSPVEAWEEDFTNV